jgi:hypothetical protein
MTRRVIRLMIVQRRPDLVRHWPAEHVKDFVSLIARIPKPYRGLPDLGRIIVPKLSRHDLMHREVQTRVDPAVADVDLVELLVQGSFEFWVLVADHERTGVRVGQIRQAHVERCKHIEVSHEASPLRVIEP